ncbi:hypothetical protein CQW49_07790 [Methylosinus trichosporium OB3b]|uniref:Uncharacterized protein n=1 Tax=Methylosinus trichosporium (strain ATCC 35070 / NCIMB 11131 / UNIQEM 75 / OB3b) TaxID=595536 RepID=A0A2D2CYK6_METT3|nr:hypothetical protein CQW49_07790 [Methylosinus trichosporium OB3b]OBS51827.1 hypothetical protein A8B73_14315 [Methylosinus sp. 3S-1]
MAARPKARERRGIEDLLAWAYLRELPKTAMRRTDGPKLWRSGWMKVEEWLEELSLAGPNENRFGVVPDLSVMTAPHEDALRVHEAVCRLDELDIGVPDDWSPCAELGDLDGHGAALPGLALARLCVTGADGVPRLRRSARALVFRHAILGGCPDWEIDPPQVRVVSEYGRPKWFLREVMWFDGVDGQVAHEVEIDGCDKWGHARPGAYQKTYLDPDPVDGVVGRGEYEIWRWALDLLVEDLAGLLVDFEAVASDRPMRPWVEAAPRKGRTLRDLRQDAGWQIRGDARRAKGRL